MVQHHLLVASRVMPPTNKLVSSLAVLKERQARGARIFRSDDFKRSDRERLIKHGFLQSVIRGWLVSSSPETTEGDTTPWFASFWEFCWLYCNHRFKQEWNLSPQQSLAHYAEKTAVPNQVVVHSPHGQNNTIKLPFGTSLFCLKQKSMPPEEDLTIHGELRVFCPEAALLRVPKNYFSLSPIEAAVVINSIREPSELLARLLKGGHSTIAGRLAGAARRLGRPGLADEILSTMKRADFDVRESDPFKESGKQIVTHIAHAHPIVERLNRLWASSRAIVIAEFPPPPDSPPDLTAYMEAIDEIYPQDAYHSLSIEGYQVTTELIERVASGKWDPVNNETHANDRNALAARGYYQAFKVLRHLLQDVYLHGDSTFARTHHRNWYRELFGPLVAAGLLDVTQLAGYRNQPVYLRGSRHVPPRWEVLKEAMPALFDILDSEPNAGVRAILSHWLFGYVHPFPDGNGRIARLLMNSLLATAGYPWTVIHVKDREEYLATLEQASVVDDLAPFARFVAAQMQRTEAARHNHLDMTSG